MKPSVLAVCGAGAGVLVLLGVLFIIALPDAAARARDGRHRAVQNACGKLGPTAGNPTLGELPVKAPDFTLPLHDGKVVSLSSRRGEVVLVNFWATWCPTCVVEMPSLGLLAARMRDRPFEILAVSVDDSWDPVDKFFESGTPLAIALDPGRTAPHAYGTDKFPETFLVDKDGVARVFIVSERDWSQPAVEECIEALIAE